MFIHKRKKSDCWGAPGRGWAGKKTKIFLGKKLKYVIELLEKAHIYVIN